MLGELLFLKILERLTGTGKGTTGSSSRRTTSIQRYGRVSEKDILTAKQRSRNTVMAYKDGMKIAKDTKVVKEITGSNITSIGLNRNRKTGLKPP